MESATVPDVVGMDLEEAVVLAVEQGVILASTDPDKGILPHSAPVPLLVRSQYPSAGTRVERFTLVTVTVSPWDDPANVDVFASPKPVPPELHEARGLQAEPDSTTE